MLDEKDYIVAAQLRDLIGSAGWDSYYQLADKELLRKTEALRTVTKDRLDYLQGEINGLAFALSLPEIHINRVKETKR